jgi:hypothetical protein
VWRPHWREAASHLCDCVICLGLNSASCQLSPPPPPHNSQRAPPALLVFERTPWFSRYAAPGHLLRSAWPSMMYYDPGVLCFVCTPNGQKIKPQRPNPVPFRGRAGCLVLLSNCEGQAEELRASTSQPASDLPGGGWADGGQPRGLRSDSDHPQVPVRGRPS